MLRRDKSTDVSNPSLKGRINMFIVGLIILLLDIWAILSLLQSETDLVTKLLWAIIIIGMPFFGLLIWYLLGPKKE